MNKKNALILTAISFTTLHVFTKNINNQTVRQGAKQCEMAVTNHCIEILCPQYCQAQYANRPNHISQCLQKCTAQQHCQLRPVAIGGIENALEDQTREQLIQCIAQMRDPSGKKSGRRMQNWQDVKTKSWKRLITHFERKRNEKNK